MHSKAALIEPLTVTPVDDEVVFLGEGAVNFSMTHEAALSTFWRLADTLNQIAHRPGAADSGGPTRVVLLVDEEPLIRRLGAVVLEEAGYAVIEAGGASEALDALETGRKVHLLFTDIELPGNLDGLQLAHLVSERWPTIGLLICSGLVQPEEHDLPTEGKFLSKPYAIDDLLRQVQEMVAA